MFKSECFEYQSQDNKDNKGNKIGDCETNETVTPIENQSILETIKELNQQLQQETNPQKSDKIQKNIADCLSDIFVQSFFRKQELKNTTSRNA